ncbi:MAG: type II toxin-antitoxin system RelE family toxin [Blastocatellia bacterium]
MKYRVEISPEAHKEIKALSGYVRSPAIEIISNLSADPRPPRARELRGKEGIYRIWLAGKWRIAYRIVEDEKLVEILRVRRKEDIDYDSL